MDVDDWVLNSHRATTLTVLEAAIERFGGECLVVELFAGDRELNTTAG